MSHRNRTLHRSASLGTLCLIAVGLSACTDTSPLQPRPHLRSVPPSRLVSGVPTLYPNSVKYSDAGKPHATGRSGNAVIQARALLDKAGVATIDVTTGELDASGTAPGAFDKIQLKGLNPEDLTTALWVDNYNALKKAALGSYTYSYANLGYDMPIQVQANVSGIDSRTDVITVVEHVKRRPDLSVLQLQSPAQALPNVPVTIGATVRELNGDVGARANCVLYVNGVEADRSNGIWVDAASVVSCAFSHQFAATGTYQLSVAVEGVVPGDWDLANNTATGSIVIRTPGDFNYSAYAEDISDYHQQYYYRQTGTYSLTSGLTGSFDLYQEFDYHQRVQYAAMDGWMPQEVAWPITAQVTHSSGGTTIGSFDQLSTSYSGVWDDGTNGYRSACAYGYADGAMGRVQLQVCSSALRGPAYGYQDDQWHGSTSFNTTRWAGLVTYTGLDYGRAQNSQGTACSGSGPDGSYCWYSNVDASNPYVDQSGLPLQPLGDTYTMSFSVTGADNATFTSTANVALQPFQTDRYPWYPQFDQPRTCTDFRYSDSYQTTNSTTCVEQHLSAVAREGWASGGPTTTP